MGTEFGTFIGTDRIPPKYRVSIHVKSISITFRYLNAPSRTSVRVDVRQRQWTQKSMIMSVVVEKIRRQKLMTPTITTQLASHHYQVCRLQVG